MADIERERRQHRLFTLLSSALAVCFIIFVIFQCGFVITGIERGEYSWTQYFIEYGDSFGAILAAFSIAFFLLQMQKSSAERLETLMEAERDRKLQLKENRLNRKIMLVKERLEFYSDLYDDFGDIYDINPPNIDQKILQKRKDINEAFERHGVKKKYPRYVDKDEIIIFAEYFSLIYRGFDKNIKEDKKEELLLIINNLVDHIIKKYEKLSTDYTQLIEQ